MSPPPSASDRPATGATGDLAVSRTPAVARTPVPRSRNALPVGTRLGEFEVTELVGEGGFGIVYLAFDHTLQRDVAIKEYMPSSLVERGENATVQALSERTVEAFEKGLASFINEARLLAQFDHPSLVKVFRFWEGNGTAYMAMPFYNGASLRDVLRAMETPPDEAWLLHLLDQLLDALAIVHEAQCFHRDIAPDNIIMVQGERPVLLDFGAARRVVGEATQALTVILKPGYAPIEQYADATPMRQGAWTDLYALGSVIHYAIHRKAPPISVGRLFSDPLEPLTRSAAGRYSEHFLAAIDRALAVRPEDRPRSVEEMRGLLGLTGQRRPARSSTGSTSRPAPSATPAPTPPPPAAADGNLTVQCYDEDFTFSPTGESIAPGTAIPASTATETGHAPAQSFAPASTTVADDPNLTVQLYDRNFTLPPPPEPSAAPAPAPVPAPAPAAKATPVVVTPPPETRPAPATPAASAPTPAAAPATDTPAPPGKRGGLIAGVGIAILLAAVAAYLASRGPGPAPSPTPPSVPVPAPVPESAPASPASAPSVAPAPSPVTPPAPASVPAPEAKPAAPAATTVEAPPAPRPEPRIEIKPEPKPRAADPKPVEPKAEPAARPAKEPAKPSRHNEAPAAAVADAEPPAVKTKPQSAPRPSRCSDLLQRASLGETLSPDEDHMLKRDCK